MIELADTSPEVNVQPAEYQRLLGYPRDSVLSERACELAERARAWYAKNGRPWVYAREAERLEIGNGSLGIEGVLFTSERLRRTLEQAEAHSVILAAVTAGPELEQEAQRLWQEEKPDEYFFLEVYGSAVVEHLTMMTGARLCARAEEQAAAVLPHYSPGYPEWEISEQSRLLQLMKPGLPAALETLDSGALRPKKSLLAVFGVTRHVDHLRRLTELVPCENCSYSPCPYRRVPYLPAAALYAVNKKALERWADERLSLERREDGTMEALFRYEGTTCMNMGRPLAFHYRVRLGSREEGHPIRELECGPAPDDTGHTSMCAYLDHGAQLMSAIARERPLLGRPLNEVLSWRRPACLAGCYCEAEGRQHKWGLVLETIHYALMRGAGKP